MTKGAFPGTRSANRRQVFPGAKGIALSVGIAIFLSGGFGIGRPGFSQQPSSPKFDVSVRKKQVLSHLNAVIQFYRNVTTPLQKIGAPNDIVYRDQAVTFATQVAQLAFQSAKAEADLMVKYQKHEGAPVQESVPAEQQRLQTAESNVESQVEDLKAQEAALDRRIASARASDRAALQEERKQLGAALDLAGSMKDALGKITGMSDSRETTDFSGAVDNLEQSMPQLQGKTPPVAAQLASLDDVRSSGVSTQTVVLFQLLGTEHSLDGIIQESDALHRQVQALRAPISTLISGMIGQGQQLSQQAAAMASASTSKLSRGNNQINENAEKLASISATFKAISSASVPLAQEMIVLEQSQANLVAWRAAVDREYKGILQTLLLRLLVIVVALAIIFIAGELWTRATNKYVREPRRRRQLLIVRRTVVGFLSAIVLLFGFVTQFNSLATFAGFITAGVAVGLQTILLSVAAYFFIIGRYGIKVGDRVTVVTMTGAPVTGDVIEVGLVRFYMMELAGNGPELQPTGRVSVFSNAVLFQTGTPIYKQIPGTEYAWHELSVKLSESADYKRAADAIVKAVYSVYDHYRESIEQQHRNVEKWMHTSIRAPEPESRLQFVGGALYLWARFPVPIKHASDTDEKLTEALLHLLDTDPAIKEAVSELPVIQAAMKG